MLFFHGSAKRLNVLSEIEKQFDHASHKLVQPGDTRWLSHEGSVDVVCRHYASICMSLEHIYQEAGVLASDAGGLLLTLRKDSTSFILTVLSAVLKPLALLRKSLQSSSSDILAGMQHAKAVIGSLQDLIDENFDSINTRSQDMISEAKSKSVVLEKDESVTPASLNSIAKMCSQLFQIWR
jgi:hypothetical protein